MNTDDFDKTIVKVESINVSFGSQKILKNISLDIKKGEIVGIIGPNGCGKTTLLNTISGFVSSSSGNIVINDSDVTDLPAYKRALFGIGRSFQHAGIFKNLTLEENIIMGVEKNGDFPWWWMFSSKYKKKMNEIVDLALKEVNLLHLKHEQAGLLSGGQIRLLELARLQLFDGNVLLIDEPTAGVSPALREKLSEMITFLNNKKFTIILVEHDLKFLFNLVDRVIVLVDGEKYMDGTPAEIRNDARLQKIYFGSE